MRIAFVTTEYNHNGLVFGGLASYLEKIANLLTTRGHEVTILTLAPKKFEAVNNGIKVNAIQEKNHFFFFLLDAFSFFFFHKAILWLAKSWMINRQLKFLHQEQAFDIVQYASTQALAFFAPSNIPWCIRNSGLLYQYNQAIGVNTYWERQKEKLQVMTLKKARFLYGPSSSTNELFRRDYGMDSALIRTPLPSEFLALGAASPIEKEHPLSGKRYILFFGTLNKLKGVQHIGPMLPYLFDYDPDLMFVFCGRDGKVGEVFASEHLKKCAGPFAANLIFPGVLDKVELSKWIRGAEIITLPSVVDNSPNTLIEALFLRKLVVCCDEASMSEIIQQGINGFICDVSVAENYFNTIRLALELREDQTNIIKLAIEKTLEEFKPESVVERTLAFYNKVINDWKK